MTEGAKLMVRVTSWVAPVGAAVRAVRRIMPDLHSFKQDFGSGLEGQGFFDN